MSAIFETVMLVCFGFSWPISVVNNYRSRTAKGMSLFFILLIFLGYVAGIAAKLLSGNDSFVLAVYGINLVLVGTNLLIYFRNVRLDREQESTRSKR
ncbi:MAG: hypothetical protein E7655_06640 [Ruminococcaceae bacterium]|nr:hypothetical protein [Oscillospiraceae bacterium]